MYIISHLISVCDLLDSNGHCAHKPEDMRRARVSALQLVEFSGYVCYTMFDSDRLLF